MSIEEPIECPLCMEPLEIDDINFFPCTCGYQICRFCWHRIRTNENGLCPACRKQYPEDPAEFKPLTEDELQRIKKERRQKDLQRKQKAAENRKHLANVRVVQKNLVFVVGLSPRLSDPEVLKKQEYFGKFGKIHKVVISQSASYAGSQVGRGPSASAYVTYIRSDDALRAILAVNNKHIDGRTLKTSLGTTKYCSHFLKGSQCPKSDCMYLHELGEEAASFTKEHMQMGKHQEYEQKLLEQFLNSQNASSSQLHVNSTSKHSRKKNTSPLTLQQQQPPSSQQQSQHHQHQKQSTQQSNQNQPNQRQPQQQHTAPSSTPPNELWSSLNNGTGNNNSKGNNSAGIEIDRSPPISRSHNASPESNSLGVPGHSKNGSGNQKVRSISENSALIQVKTNSDCDTSHIPAQSQTQQTSQHSPPEQMQQHSPPLGNIKSSNPFQNRQHSSSVAMPPANLPPPPPATTSDSNHSHSHQPQQQQLSSVHFPRPNYEQPILSGSRPAAPPGLSNQRRALMLAQHNNSLSLFTTGNGFTNRMQPKPVSHVINSEPLPNTEIPDTIAVSSSTDWQAAFGFGSQQKDVLDDDLGFDPWDESSKGLADLIEKENNANCIQQNPYNVHTMPVRMPNGLHHPHMFGGMDRSLPPHAAAQMAQQAAAMASGANMPSIPPGFSPNFLNQYRQQMQQHQQQQFIRPDGGGSRMMNFMNLPPRVPLPPQNKFTSDPLQQGKDTGNISQDWQDGLRALLPNINISFSGQPQQQTYSTTPPTNTLNSTINSSHTEAHNGPLAPESPPHWMKSLHQLTESDSPSPNHRLPFAQQFIGNNSNWATHNHNNPPPGFQAIRTQSIEQAHTVTDPLQ